MQTATKSELGSWVFSMDDLKYLTDEERIAIEENILAELDVLTSGNPEAVDELGQLFFKIDSEIDFLAHESARINKRKKELEEKQDRMKRHVVELLDLANSKFVGRIHSFGLTISEGTVVEIPASALPEEFRRTVTTVEPDKTAIKTAIKTGREIPGCRIETRKNLRLK